MLNTCFLKPILAVSLAVALSACATSGPEPLPTIPTYPSAEWLEDNNPLYQEVATLYPSKQNIVAAKKVQALLDQRQRELSKLHQVDRELTLSWGNRGRAGAAMLQPAYIHVLGESHNDHYDLNNQAFTPSRGFSSDSHGQGAGASDPTRHWQTAGASMYEMQRWGRFCDDGTSMDESDWQFVTKAGAHDNIPDVLLMDCNPPAHDYDDYLAAWSRFCDQDGLSTTQKDIVRHSSRPYRFTDACPGRN